MSLMCLLKSRHVIFLHAHRPPCHAYDYEIKIKTLNIFCFSILLSLSLSFSYHHLHKVHTNQTQIRAPAQVSTLKLAYLLIGYLGVKLVLLRRNLKCEGDKEHFYPLTFSFSLYEMSLLVLVTCLQAVTAERDKRK